MSDVLREEYQVAIANSLHTISGKLVSPGFFWAWSLAGVARFCRMALPLYQGGADDSNELNFALSPSPAKAGRGLLLLSNFGVDRSQGETKFPGLAAQVTLVPDTGQRGVSQSR
jgi:hypothetical protein